MQTALAVMLLLITVHSAGAQNPSHSRKENSGRTVFGSLLTDKSLQHELRLGKWQIKRMQEIYIQSVPPAKVVFSPWGVKQLGISELQLREVHRLDRERNEATLRILTEKPPGVDSREKLRKVRESELQFQGKFLKVLTKEQWMKFEQLKGKPYRRLNPQRAKKKLDL